MRLSVLALLAAFSMPVIAHADNIVADPDFALGTFDGNGYGKLTDWTQSPATSYIGGFPYLTGSNVAGQPFYNGAPPDGTTVGFIQVYGPQYIDTLYQSLSTVAGGGYLLTFYENARPGNTVDLVASIDGSPLGDANAVSFANGWVEQTYSFVASSTSTTLSFTALQDSPGADETVLLNDVSVVATPEPSSLMLLGTGILGVAGFARRRLLGSR